MEYSKKYRKAEGLDWRRAPYPLDGVLVMKSGHEVSGGGKPSVWHFRGGADRVWLLLDGCRTVSDLVWEVGRVFPEADAVSDIEDFVEFLLDQGLLSG